MLGRPPANLGIKDRMVRKLATKPGRAVYALRKKIVEPVFAQIKEARGFRRFPFFAASPKCAVNGRSLP